MLKKRLISLLLFMIIYTTPGTSFAGEELLDFDQYCERNFGVPEVSVSNGKYLCIADGAKIVVDAGSACEQQFGESYVAFIEPGHGWVCDDTPGRPGRTR